MAKAVFFGIPATGHINPSFPMLTELVRRGEQVIYVNTEEIRPVIKTTGAVFYPLPESAPISKLSDQASSGNMGQISVMFAKSVETLLPFAMDLLRTEQPDYVIFDSLAGWGKQAAVLLHIPSVASIAIFVLHNGAFRLMTPAMFGNIAGSMLTVMPQHIRIAHRMRKNFGVESGGIENTGDLNIVYTSAAFQPNAERLDKSFHFVGPSITPRLSDPDFPFEQIKHRPVVYISLGTINNQNLKFYRQCFAAFAHYPAHFILSAGKKTNLDELGDIPDNFIVRNAVPQLKILERSDVFITHGGMNSVSEGLWYGVPLIAIPQQMEQSIVARVVAQKGAGLALAVQPPYGHVTTGALRTALDSILTNHKTYQQAAVRLGDSFRAAGGYMRAADDIIAFSRSL